ncbi:MAG TPA: hypothetical protein VGM27_03830 [Acidobacteriaceae bacterium]
MRGRMDTMLATNDDAQLILKLYELRTEAGMRTARKWVTGEFWPKSAQDVVQVLRAFGSQENNYLRQVVSYWDMAAAFVLHGALDGSLFLDCCSENLFIFAKFWPFLNEIRVESAGFLKQTEELTIKFSSARERVENIRKAQDSRQEQVANR